MSAVSKVCRGLLCGAALMVLAAPAVAQDVTNNVVANDVIENDAYNATTTPYDNAVTTTDAEHDDDFPWGLLGLLGLAGLLGLKRRDDARDINVDARRDTRG